ncbi:MAG: helix-turn-helix domain-containing protein [bacterium]
MKVQNIADIAAIARERRKAIGLSQSQLAEASGVGRDWIVQFEKGKATVKWVLVIRVLRELGFALDLSLPTQKQVTSGHDLDAILKSKTKEIQS